MQGGGLATPNLRKDRLIASAPIQVQVLSGVPILTAPDGGGRGRMLLLRLAIADALQFDNMIREARQKFLANEILGVI